MTTEQAHNNLKHVLFNGRILINGLPPTANEMAALIQGEQMLFEKAMQLDKTSELAAKQEIPKAEIDRKGNVVKLPVNPSKKGK